MQWDTLEELESHEWPPPRYNSRLVTTVHRLRKKPLAEFTVEDLRIMIGQGIGLPHLMPLAIAILERDPLAEGDYYPGDLLAMVVHAESWLAGQLALGRRVVAVVRRALAGPREVQPELHRRLIAFVDRLADAEPGTDNRIVPC